MTVFFDLHPMKSEGEPIRKDNEKSKHAFSGGLVQVPPKL